VTSARELAEREIRFESGELQEDPKGEGEELQLIYESMGMSSTEAKRMADQSLSDKNATLDALEREELGIDPTELGGSPYEAALTSFMLFALGAIIPILPFLVFGGGVAVSASVGLSGLGLFAVGAAITIFTGVAVWRSGSRQLALGLGAAGVTFFIGRIVGAAIT